MDKQIKHVLNLIKKNDVITIYGHINPDYDSYASSLALRDLIKENFKNKQVYALGEGPDRFFDMLGKYDNPSDETISKSLAIICDCSEIGRVQEQRIKLAKQIIKIDHHLETQPFLGVKWVDTNSIACSQLIAEFAIACHLKISKNTADLLYLGLVTDSGRFRYAPTNAKTHQIVAKLYELGCEPKKLFDVLYISDEALVKYQAFLVSSFKRTKNDVLYCFADVNDYKKFGLTFEQISKNINVLGGIKDAKAWVLFTRAEDKTIRVEFRSNGLDVQKIAIKYGGGGHKCASGARLLNQEDFSLAMKIVEDLDENIGKNV